MVQAFVLVSVLLLCYVMLEEYFMQVVPDVRRNDRIFVVFSFDELDKISLQTARTQDLRERVIKRILEWGILNFPYLPKHKAYGDN